MEVVLEIVISEHLEHSLAQDSNSHLVNGEAFHMSLIFLKDISCPNIYFYTYPPFPTSQDADFVYSVGPENLPYKRAPCTILKQAEDREVLPTGNGLLTRLLKKKKKVK